jgi:hypothetical protein
MNKFIAIIIATIALSMAGSAYAGNFDKIDLEGSVSTLGFTLSHDDDNDVKIKYSADVTGYNLGGSLYYEHSDQDANIVGVGLHANSNIGYGNILFASEIDWDLTNTEWDSESTIKYSIFNIGAYINVRFDIDEISYTGNDFGLDYTIKLNNNLSIIPSVEVPFNKDFDRQDATAAIHLAFSF